MSALDEYLFNRKGWEESLDKSAIWMVPQPFNEAFLDFALDEKDRLGQVYVEILGRIVCLDNVMLEELS